MPPKTTHTPEQVASDLAERGATVEKPTVKDRGKFVSCTCDWRSTTRYSSNKGATQAWTAHMYALGFKTSDSIEFQHDHELIY